MAALTTISLQLKIDPIIPKKNQHRRGFAAILRNSLAEHSTTGYALGLARRVDAGNQGTHY